MRQFPGNSLRGYAIGMARKHLTGRKQAEAMAWIKDPARTSIDLSRFIDRLQAAHPNPSATEAPNGEQTPS